MASPRIKKLLIAISQRQDLVLVMLLVLAIMMMILPLPTVLVDTLIATNIAITIMLLMVAIYLKDPLEFSTLPAVILLTTIFRLALSITTTRLILIQADAGQIIETFGTFVVGGNVVVGLVVFLIITVVQFVVITKGAERVAEVSARFSLDALPGKQMSIDSDLRSGTIDMVEARRRRQHLEKESQLYGLSLIHICRLHLVRDLRADPHRNACIAAELPQQRRQVLIDHAVTVGSVTPGRRRARPDCR